MTKRMKKPIVISFLIIIAILFPLLTNNDYYIHILTLAFIWIIAVYGLNLLLGYTGYLSLAHAGFFAIGAYALGLLTVKAGVSFWLAFILAPIITTIIGLFIGLIALRTKGDYFSIYTLCVGYVIYLVIDKWDALTGGVRGLIGIPAPGNIGPISFDTPISQYYLVLTILLLSIFVIYRIIYSLVGRTFIAIRNSELLAQSIGISSRNNKLLSFVLSTFFAGLSGALYASFIRFIGPEIGSTNMVFDFLIFLIVGGMGTMAGPIIGTLLMVWLSQNLQFLQDYRMVIFGPVLVLIIIYSPNGLAGVYYNLRMRWEERKRNKHVNSLHQSEVEKEG